MRTILGYRIILSALLVALAVPVAARPEEEEKPRSKTQKRMQTVGAAAQAQTQTAPAEVPKEKGKAQTAPGKAGVRAVQGKVTGVSQERRSVLIRTSSTEFLVFVTPKTVLRRDGKPVDLNSIRPQDRVDSCRFNAKNVVQEMIVTSQEKARTTPLPPLPEP